MARNCGFEETFSCIYWVAMFTALGPEMIVDKLDTAEFHSASETTRSFDDLAVAAVCMDGTIASANAYKVFHCNSEK